MQALNVIFHSGTEAAA